MTWPIKGSLCYWPFAADWFGFTGAEVLDGFTPSPAENNPVAVTGHWLHQTGGTGFS